MIYKTIKQPLCSIVLTFASQKQNLCLLNPEHVNGLYICIQSLITTEHATVTLSAKESCCTCSGCHRFAFQIDFLDVHTYYMNTVVIL